MQSITVSDPRRIGQYPGPVSYTHLDVYKRQGDRETLNSTLEPTTEANKEEVEEQTPMKNGIWWAAGAIIFIFAGAGFYLRQRGENIE